MTTQTPNPFLTFPDGSDVMVERFTEQTFVETAELLPDGPEYRRPGRAFPRYELSGKFVLFDDERATLADMENGAEVLVPCWMHGLSYRQGYGSERFAPAIDVIHPANTAGKSFLIENAAGARRVFTTPATGNKNLAAGWLHDDVRAWPVVRARLADDSFSIETQTPAIHTAQLTFISDEPREPVGSSYPFQYAPLLQVLTPDWHQSIKTDINHSANAFDNGNVRTWELRHTKRGVSVLLTALNRADIVLLRSFLLTKRGRWKSFVWTDPRDGNPKQFRLASDVVELKYINSTTMQAAVRFIEVNE